MVDLILETNCCHVIVTHGTDTLIETAKYVGRKLKGVACVVVFVGAFLPETFKVSVCLK